jgi:hypothetical protein
VVELFARHQGVFGELEFIGGDDCKAVLDRILSANAHSLKTIKRSFIRLGQTHVPGTTRIIGKDALSNSELTMSDLE